MACCFEETTNEKNFPMRDDLHFVFRIRFVLLPLPYLETTLPFRLCSTSDIGIPIYSSSTKEIACRRSRTAPEPPQDSFRSQSTNREGISARLLPCPRSQSCPDQIFLTLSDARGWNICIKRSCRHAYNVTDLLRSWTKWIMCQISMCRSAS